jgi:hypothetical protein
MYRRGSANLLDDLLLCCDLCNDNSYLARNGKLRALPSACFYRLVDVHTTSEHTRVYRQRQYPENAYSILCC